MADRETAHFRGEAGLVIAMDLPLPEVMAEKVVKGYLTRVNADGSPYVEATGAKPEAEQPPAANASKAYWVGYAHRVHGVPIDDAEALTKHDLMELYGTKA
jgi:hypothetical protein